MVSSAPVALQGAPVDSVPAEIAPEMQRLPPVRVVRSARRHKTASARMADGVLVVRIPAWMTTEEEQVMVNKILGRVEEKLRCGQVPLESRARELAARFGLPEPRSINWSSRQRLRWGSCTSASGDIRISTRLADAPGWVLDHVIVHELAHLVVADHSPEFQALVNRNPDAERAEGYLQALNDMGGVPQALAGSL